MGGAFPVSMWAGTSSRRGVYGAGDDVPQSSGLPRLRRPSLVEGLVVIGAGPRGVRGAMWGR